MTTRSHRKSESAGSQLKDYVLPAEGIRYEVIAADIKAYLGNAASVKQIRYRVCSTIFLLVIEKLLTRAKDKAQQIQAGYQISAPDQLTIEMIADLKRDSIRWGAEQRTKPGVNYGDSNTHNNRLKYGPTPTPMDPEQAIPHESHSYSSSRTQSQAAARNPGRQARDVADEEQYQKWVDYRRFVEREQQRRQQEQAGRGHPPRDRSPATPYPSRDSPSQPDSDSSYGEED